MYYLITTGSPVQLYTMVSPRQWNRSKSLPLEQTNKQTVSPTQAMTTDDLDKLSINSNMLCETESSVMTVAYEELDDDLNRCIICGIDMGTMNPRQYCNKTYCPYEGV